MKIERIRAVTEELINSLNTNFIPGTPEGKTSQWDLINANKFVADEDNIFLIAFENTMPVGVITAYRLQRLDTRGSELFFYEIGVHEDFRKKGIARLLIDELKEIGTTVNASEMFVLTNQSNSPALKLYEITGGKIEEDNVVMFSYDLKK